MKKIPFLLREEGSGTRRAFEGHLKDFGLTLGSLDVIATLGSSAAVIEAVRAGLGASVASRISVDEDLKKGSLVEIKMPGTKMKRSFYIVIRKGRTLPPAYGAFFEHLAREAKR
jgi:DNA-binding transcriptional LysR family regulator